MSADLLRRAAAKIREDWPDPPADWFLGRPVRDARAWRAVADWLDTEADNADEDAKGSIYPNPTEFLLLGTPGLAVARAYLGEQS